jgi:hypothetical protein
MPGQLEVYLLNDEVTNDRLTASGYIEFSNGYVTSVTPMERPFALEENDSTSLGEGTASIDLRVTTGDDGVVVEFAEDQYSCLEALMCDGYQYAILCQYDEGVRSTKSIGFEKEGKRAYCDYSLFNLAEGFDDGTISVAQTDSGDVVFTLAADSGRLNGTLELINLDIVNLDYRMGGDGLES